MYICVCIYTITKVNFMHNRNILTKQQNHPQWIDRHHQALVEQDALHLSQAQDCI